MDANTIRNKLAALEQQAEILRQALKIMESGNAAGAHSDENGKRRSQKSKGKPRAAGGQTIAAMAEAALEALHEYSTPKEIERYIMEVHKVSVNSGTLISILWRGDKHDGVFKKGRKAGTYGLRAWVSNGKARAAPHVQAIA